jgi:predicted NUDIX family NTP pyrophosphohydrolase
MPKESAGLLPFRCRHGRLEVFLVHPGGPFWARKDEGAWSIPKGEFGPGEDPLAAAKREFTEETGFTADGEAIPLQPLRQRGGKRVHAWAMRLEIDPERLRSNTFLLEWPPRSGKHQAFPEVDRAAWFPLPEAMHKILQSQAGLLVELEAKVPR